MEIKVYANREKKNGAPRTTYSIDRKPESYNCLIVELPDEFIWPIGPEGVILLHLDGELYPLPDILTERGGFPGLVYRGPGYEKFHAFKIVKIFSLDD
jgi:hypothetical protein